MKNLTRVDAILLTHGHRSHVGNTVEIAYSHPISKVFCVHEVSLYLQHEGLPVEQAIGMNFGGTVDLAEGIQATLVPSMHSSWYFFY